MSRVPTTESSLDRILTITCLTTKKNHEEAMKILKHVTKMVRPIMKTRNWTVGHLAEFYPSNPHLLGLNINRGQKIQIRIRYANDENRFLEMYEIIGTMLHELTHIVRGPHDATFHKILDGLFEEYEKLEDSGYTGVGFDSKGNQLGGMKGRSRTHPHAFEGRQYTLGGGGGGGGNQGTIRNTTAGGGGVLGDTDTKRAIAEAAEKRRKANENMLPTGGVRLGGGGGSSGIVGGSKYNDSKLWEQWQTPGEMAVLAAERRARDNVWCGSMQDDDDDDGSRSTNRTTPTPPLTTNSTPSLPSTLPSRPSSRSTTSATLNSPYSRLLPTGLSKSAAAAAARAASTLKPKDRTAPKVTVSHGNQTTASATTAASVSGSGNAITEIDPVPTWTEWACNVCTLVNRPLALQCECCLAERSA